MQKGRNRLIGYASKSLPKACANYGITELEMTGLMVQGLSVPFACVGSGDPVRVLHLYTMNTLDTL